MKATNERTTSFPSTLANVDRDNDEHVGASFPMCVFELVPAVPEDAADDKKSYFLISVFFKKIALLFHQSFFFFARMKRDDERKEHVDDTAFLPRSFSHHLPRACGAEEM